MRRLCLLLVLVVTFASTTVFSQGKSITEQEYKAGRETAMQKTMKKTHRSTAEEKTFSNNALQMIETMTIDRFPNEDSRWIGIRTKDGKTEEFLNLIYLGKYEYRKENGSDWTKRCIRDCGPAGASGSFGFSGSEAPKVAEYLVFDVKVGDRPAKKYVVYRVYQVGLVLRFYREDLYVGENGLITRIDDTTSEVFPSNVTRTQVATYNYDVELPQLVAPIK